MPVLGVLVRRECHKWVTGSQHSGNRLFRAVSHGVTKTIGFYIIEIGVGSHLDEKVNRESLVARNAAAEQVSDARPQRFVVLEHLVERCRAEQYFERSTGLVTPGRPPRFRNRWQRRLLFEQPLYHGAASLGGSQRQGGLMLFGCLVGFRAILQQLFHNLLVIAARTHRPE